MPEGPEIRRAADSIAAVLEGREVLAVEFGLPRLHRQARQLRGQRVIAVETRGKALLIHFEHGWSIYSHNQLYGVWRVQSGHGLAPGTRSLRLLLQTESDSAVLYSASDISVWRTEELAAHPFLAKLGPDIMNPGLRWRDIAARLQQPPFAGRGLGSLYLDQGFLAGVGNYLRSEILYAAGVHHQRRAGTLGTAECGHLARATLEVSRRSYRTAGITLKPALAAALKRRKLPREQRRFAVFGRGDQPCYGCGEAIVRREVGSRRLYFCPGCQPA